MLTEIAQVGLLGLLLSGLFAAAMSSIDSGINALTATVVCDWMSNRQLKVGFSRLLCGLFGAGGILAAVVILYQQSEVYQLIISLSGTFLGLLLGIFLLGMLVKRANPGGVLIGLAAASLTLALAWEHVGGQWYGAFTCLPTVCGGLAGQHLFCGPIPGQAARTGAGAGTAELRPPTISLDFSPDEAISVLGTGEKRVGKS